ncbi:MAG: PTS sugar transporter subunit IIA [Pseudomonadota bacterium]|nr:PTS sugar transporter subunit IIA [Pseudomonadota bacterium]
MEISTLLTAQHIYCDVAVSSKKRAMDVLSALLVEAGAPLSESEIFNGLIARERLGSTGLGHGIAIPHGRFSNLTRTVAILVQFAEPIDYDAIDGEPVDLVVALMVPERSTEEHLRLLATLAEMFSDADTRNELRHAATPEQVAAVVACWCPADDQADA